MKTQQCFNFPFHFYISDSLLHNFPCSVIEAAQFQEVQLRRGLPTFLCRLLSMEFYTCSRLVEDGEMFL